MVSSNDHIIEEVFQAILEHVGEQAPEAAFYNSMKQANLPIDNRMLANFIIQDFPWPVGVELRRLFSGDLRNRDKARVDQLLKVAEKLAQFFAFCLLVQVWDEAKKNKIEFSKDLEVHLDQLKKPSFGSYIGLIRSIHTVLESAGIQPFLEYNREGFSFKKLLKNYNQLLSMRNEDRHHTSEMDCQEGEDLLKAVLKDLAFFAKYKLVTIKEIKVIGPKMNPVHFQHSIRMLNSQHEDFTSVEQSYEEFSESHSVLLMKEFSSPKHYLNLSPFVVDTSTMIENQKIQGIKNGIYMYGYMKDERFIYVLTNAPEPAVFNDLPQFHYLKNQFDDLHATLNMNGSYKG